MNKSWTFQSSLPTVGDVTAIQRKAAELQAAHIKALVGRLGARFFGR